MNYNNNEKTDRRLRTIEIIVGLVIIALLIALLNGEGIVRREDLQEDLRRMADEAAVHAVDGMTYEGGDTYTFTLEGAASSDLLAASQGLLSTVSVYAGFTVRDGRQTAEEYYTGAGVIYKLNKDRGDAYIITNYHVIYNGAATTDDGVSDDLRYASVDVCQWCWCKR